MFLSQTGFRGRGIVEAHHYSTFSSGEESGISPVCRGCCGLLLGIQKDQTRTLNSLERCRSQPPLGEIYLFLAHSGGRRACSLYSLNIYYCLEYFPFPLQAWFDFYQLISSKPLEFEAMQRLFFSFATLSNSF